MAQAGVENQVSGSLNPVGWDRKSKLLDMPLRNSLPREQHSNSFFACYSAQYNSASSPQTHTTEGTSNLAQISKIFVHEAPQLFAAYLVIGPHVSRGQQRARKVCGAYDRVPQGGKGARQRRHPSHRRFGASAVAKVANAFEGLACKPQLRRDGTQGPLRHFREGRN
jgi:hypothetical protein